MHSFETIPANILEKTMIKYSIYTNHLQFSLRCRHNKILPKGLQLESRIKTERSKIILQYNKLLLQELIHINHVIRDRIKNSLHTANSHEKSFDLTKKKHKYGDLMN